ncbi:MAG TPA: translation initiation factor IF-2 [Candidatus Didemnitutus sp.]|nr:translation initiation factor IF-2 [Candidatus Didemnitutus sp.]
MSSTESSGAPAEGTATTQSGATATAPTFGTSRGSGLARGKRTSSTPATPAGASAAEYKPTAIEIVNAPREYKNPFAPAASETSEAASVAVLNEPAPVSPVSTPVAAEAPAPVEAPVPTETAAPETPDEKVELNILPPERPKAVAPQTWESEGFQNQPNREREPRQDRPRREFRRDNERRDEAPVPSKFRYERAKDGPLPPRPPPSSSAPTPAAPAKSGGFVGWLKSIFGAKPAAAPAEGRSSEPRPEGRDGQGHRRHRGGRGRGHFHGQGQGGPGGENRPRHEGQGDHHEGGGQRRRRRRHGRGHGHGGGHGHEHRDQAGDHSNSSAT